MFSLRIMFALSLLLLATIFAGAADFTAAVSAADLDAAQCRAYAGNRALAPAPDGVLPVLLGLQPPGEKLLPWSTGLQLENVLTFRIAFTQPKAIGTIISTFNSGQLPGQPLPKQGTTVSILKPTAAYPGDIANPDAWIMLPPGEVKTLPHGTTTRALRFQSIQGGWGYAPGGDNFQALMPSILLFTERYYSATNLGHARVTGKQGGPRTWLAEWKEQTLAGIVTMDGNAPATVSSLNAAVTTHYLLADDKDWLQQKPLNGSVLPLIYTFAAPVTTKVLRMVGGGFNRVFPLVNLGNTPDVPSMVAPPSPYTVRYNMPMDGFVAIHIIDKKSGKIIRRLVAEVEREKGLVAEPWDLKDDAGKTVSPGEYQMKAVARPPFKLTYQLTPYNAGQPPWWAPAPGKGGGGWMADHTSPQSAMAIGDKIFLSSPCNESGDGVIAVDLEGNKLWGEPWINGFDIAQRLAADDRYIYAINPSVIQRIDTQQSNAARTIHTFAYTRDLPASNWDDTHGGMAARNGKVYLGFSAPPVSWLQSSFLAEDFNNNGCFPMAWLAKGKGSRAGFLDDKIYGQQNYDELMRMYAAFLTGITPAQTATWPSTAIPSSTQAYFGDAAQTGPMTNNLIAAFKRPVTIGSVLVPDGNIKVFVLKPGAPLPSDDPAMAGMDPAAVLDDLFGGGIDEDNWIPLTREEAPPGRPAIFSTAEGGVQTRALRFKAKRVDFALVTARRFENIAAQAERVFSEGTGTPTGGWTLSRPEEKSVNIFNAPAMVMAWPQAVTLRGVAIVQPRGGVMTVENYIGPEGSDPKAAVSDDKLWKELGRFAPEIFVTYFPQIPTLRTVDFGALRKIRALRIRALTPPTNSKPDSGGPWPANTPVLSNVVAFRHLGGDPPGLAPDMSQRLIVMQSPTDDKEVAKELKHVPFPEPGQMVFDKAGTLYAVSAGRIVSVTLDAEGIPTGESKEVVPAAALEIASALAVDNNGLIYVSDLGPQVIKVFNIKTGKLTRTIGKPGGHKLGAWDPNCMDRPTGLTIDSAGKIWVAHNSSQPKRISRWNPDGTHEKSFFGPTFYGGGGTMDGGDRSVINYLGMKFVIDWNKLDWKLDSLLYRPGLSVRASYPDRTVYLKGRRYLVGNTNYLGVALIAVERDRVAVPLVVVGNLQYWDEIAARPELAQAFGALDRSRFGFCWTDKNDDGIPQPTEVQITQKNPMGGCSIGDDLAINGDGFRLRPVSFLANGAPVYDLEGIEILPLMSARAWSATDGKTFTMVNQWNRQLAPDGKTVQWNYWDEFAVHAGWYASGFGYDRPPGVLNAEQSIFGHLTDVPAKAGTEEYWVTNSDQGDWFLFTADGFLVGCIFGGPTGYGLRRLTMPEWEPGKVDFSDVRLLQECYQGQVINTKEGVYAIAGKNHMSVVKVDGLEQLERLSSTVTVTEADLTAVRSWEEKKSLIEKASQDSKATRVPYTESPPQINGFLEDWPSDLFFTVQDYHKIGFHVDEWIILAEAAISYDSDNLYLAVSALDESPMRNSAENTQTLFKNGDAVDFTLGLNAKADPARTTPVVGDLRIVLSRVKGKPVAVLYRYVAAQKPVNGAVHFSSPVSELWVDEVKELPEALVAIGEIPIEQGRGWRLEASIPWKALGATSPGIGTRLRGDIGILQSDQNGVQTVNRLYWSGKSQRCVTDLPTEARIQPGLWGDFYCSEPPKGMIFGPGDFDPLDDFNPLGP